MVGAPPLRHRPGAGLVLGLIGLALLLASLTLLPWTSLGGEDQTFGDIRDAFDGPGEPTAPNPALDYIDAYAGSGGWVFFAGLAVVAVLFTTWIVPSSKAGRVCTGLFMAGLVGVVANAVDDKGTVGPRLSGALAAGLSLFMHGYFYTDLFDQDFGDPAWGAWAGLAGLLLVCVACVVGTRTEPAPAYG